MSKFKKLVFDKPFGSIEPGTTLEYSDDDEMYLFDERSETNLDSDSNSAMMVNDSTIMMTPEYANKLVQKGVLKVVEDLKQTDSQNKKQNFVNVFDEIDRLESGINDDMTAIELRRKNSNDYNYKDAALYYRLDGQKSVLSYLKSLKK